MRHRRRKGSTNDGLSKSLVYWRHLKVMMKSTWCCCASSCWSKSAQTSSDTTLCTKLTCWLKPNYCWFKPVSNRSIHVNTSCPQNLTSLYSPQPFAGVETTPLWNKKLLRMVCLNIGYRYPIPWSKSSCSQISQLTKLFGIPPCQAL